MMSLKIYFCGSIGAGRQDAELYKNIIIMLQNYGKVLTEHIGYDKPSQVKHLQGILMYLLFLLNNLVLLCKLYYVTADYFSFNFR